MFKFFGSIIDAVGSLFSFIGMFISSIVQVFVLVGKGMAYITVCIAELPPFLVVFLMAFVGISVVYLIVGR